MIKVVLVIPTLDRSGAEKQFTLLATGLPRDEFDVHAVALTRSGPYAECLRAAGIPLTVLNKRLRFDPIALWRLRTLVRQLNPDVLHSWLFAANAACRLIAPRQPRPQVVVSERCVDSWKSGWQLRLDRRQIRRTARLVANSVGVADFYRDLGVPDDKLVIIPNGIEIPDKPVTGREAATGRGAVLAELDIPPDARIIGYAGRLARQKRVRDLVWAMQLLKQLTDRVCLLIIGDGPERRRLEGLARHLGCDHLIRFTGHREDAGRLIRLLNVFWLASDFEGMSNSVMEAMAAGVPVIATDILPNRELVLDGETGYLVGVKDAVGFAQFTDRILADDALASRLGTAGRQRMQQNFSVTGMVDAYARLYRDLVTTRASHSKM